MKRLPVVPVKAEDLPVAASEWAVAVVTAAVDLAEAVVADLAVAVVIGAAVATCSAERVVGSASI